MGVGSAPCENLGNEAPEFKCLDQVRTGRLPESCGVGQGIADGQPCFARRFVCGRPGFRRSVRCLAAFHKQKRQADQQHQEKQVFDPSVFPKPSDAAKYRREVLAASWAPILIGRDEAMAVGATDLH